MQLTVHLPDAHIHKILASLDAGKKHRPESYKNEMTVYWETHLSKISLERIAPDTLRMTGESGFYFPGMTYTGLDFINALYKRYTVLHDISGTRYDIEIPQMSSTSLGYMLSGKHVSVDFLRSIHHARQILTATNKAGVVIPERPRILEIGSGTGIQALVFHMLMKHSTYFLVDFPETLALAHTFLTMVLPESRILTYDMWRDNPGLLTNNEYDFVCVPNYAIKDIPSSTIHLGINTDSMQEMNYATITMYFNEIRRLLTAPRLFYQCNRDKMMDGTLIKVDAYPYRPEDKELLRTVDAFNKNLFIMRKCFGRFPLLRRISIPLFTRRGSHISILKQMV